MAISQWSDRSMGVKKPQLDFEDKIDNYQPFVPRIESKPNALPGNPLSKVLLDYNEVRANDSNSPLPQDKSIFDHPYEEELERLVFPATQLERVTPQKPRELSDTPCEVISEKEQLLNLIKKLQNCSEIAVDMENYSYRSYQGFVCLIQISTRSEDFIIDAIALRSEIHLLNEVFTNPKILKVLHGAGEDIKWLQRDFGVYVVNMFDTALATRELGHQHSSLDYVLYEICGIPTSGKKKMQLADWRIRPVPDEMLKYAQRDTHYLLYIYDVLKNELIDTDISNPETEESNIRYVLEESLVICYQRYRLPRSENFYRKRRNKINKNLRPLFKLLCQWRDKTGRDEDESVNYVMPNGVLLEIVQEMPEDILKYFKPLLLQKHPLIQKYANEVQGFIDKARNDFNSDSNSGNAGEQIASNERSTKPRKKYYRNQRPYRAGKNTALLGRNAESEVALQENATENDNSREVNASDMAE